MTERYTCRSCFQQFRIGRPHKNWAIEHLRCGCGIRFWNTAKHGKLAGIYPAEVPEDIAAANRRDLQKLYDAMLQRKAMARRAA